MFDAIIKTLIPILKDQKYNKKKEKNSLILRLDDIGSNIIKGSIDLYSNYYNPYTGNDELKESIQNIVDNNLYIFNDILDDEIDLDIIERGTDFFDNNWEDYTYDDIVHFCYRKDQKEINDLNAGFIIVLANSAYFGFKKENELQLILEEEKSNIGTFNLSLIYNNESHYIASTQITEEESKTKSRRDQILSIINDIITGFIRVLKTFELVFLEIRKENSKYRFELDDENIYNRLDKYFNPDSIYYKWVYDENRSLSNSKYIDCIKDLKSYFINADIKTFRDNQKEIENSYLENIDTQLDYIVSTIEGITCSYENKSTTLIVPPDIKSSIKSIITYKYYKDKHYSFNVGSTEIINKEDNSVMYFPIVLLMDEDSNIIDKSSIEDMNIQKCYDDILDWLKVELMNFGIPIDAIEASIDNISSGAISKNDGITNKNNVIVLDKKVTENMNLNDILRTISNAINKEDEVDISDLTLDNPIQDKVNKSLINRNHKNKRNNSIIKNIEFEDALQYSNYIEEKLLPYIDSIFIQFCMNNKDLKQISELLYNFSNMTENEYYNKKNIYNDISFGDFFQGDSFIININYKNILLDTILVWYGQNDDDNFYIGRIFDKINCAIPRTKDWYRTCCKYNTQGGLNLNLCSYAGIANVDLTGLCKYVFDDKFNKQLFEEAVRIDSGKRSKDHRIFEISSYIWSTISSIFMKKYISEKRYNGEEQYEEFDYLKSLRSFNISKTIDALSDLIKDGKIDKQILLTVKYMIESYINNKSIFKDIDENNNFNPEDSAIDIIIPNNDKLYCEEFNTEDKSIGKYYIKKSRKKYLNKNYDVLENSERFSINSIMIDDNPEDYKCNIILIQNIKNTEEFLKDLLKILKYLEYDFNNIK